MGVVHLSVKTRLGVGVVHILAKTLATACPRCFAAASWKFAGAPLWAWCTFQRKQGSGVGVGMTAFIVFLLCCCVSLCFVWFWLKIKKRLRFCGFFGAWLVSSRPGKTILFLS